MNEEKVEALRLEIDRLDNRIIELIRHRTIVAKTIGNAKVNAGGTRIDLVREREILARYIEVLPTGGSEIALLLFRMSRGS